MKKIGGHKRPWHRQICHRLGIYVAGWGSLQLPDPGLLPTLLMVPPNIWAIRDQVFHITQDVTWSVEQFREYWGYMDNFLVLNSPRPIKDGKQTLNYWCYF